MSVLITVSGRELRDFAAENNYPPGLADWVFTTAEEYIQHVQRARSARKAFKEIERFNTQGWAMVLASAYLISQGVKL